jgi:transposase-like protein
MLCPHCFSKHVVKAGFHNTVKNGKRQRFQCGECAKTFYKESVK